MDTQYFTTDKELEFVGIFERYVQRDGWLNLLKHLKVETDFFVAPASTCHHGAYEGGLLDHSLNVFHCLDDIRRMLVAKNILLPVESCVICGLLHDVCKANQYHLGKKWVKGPVGWQEVSAYTYKDDMPLGHGEKSVMMILPYMCLTGDEMLAIRWHMGRFDSSADTYNGLQTLNAAQRTSPLVTALHLADMMASWFDETSYE